MERATAHARKAFKYPSEDDDLSGRDELDEEEQERIITSLTTTSATSNDIYTLAFTLLPLLPAPLFISTILFGTSAGTGSSTAQARLLSLLSLTSLLATSAHMLLMPFAGNYADTTTGGAGTGAAMGNGMGMSTLSDIAARRRARQGKLPARNATLLQRCLDLLDEVRAHIDPASPLVQALPWLNFALVGVVTLAAVLLYGRAGQGDVFWVWLGLPGGMLGLVLFVEWTLAKEEVEVRKLGGLRYGYRGA